MIKKYVDGPEVISREKAFSTEHLDVYHLHLADDVMECYLAGWRDGSSAAPTSYVGFLSASVKKGGEHKSHTYTVMGCPIYKAPNLDTPEVIISIVAELLCGIQEFVGPLSFDVEDGLDSLGMDYDELQEYLSNTPFMDKQQ
jgi:hypothetical protein